MYNCVRQLCQYWHCPCGSTGPALTLSLALPAVLTLQMVMRHAARAHILRKPPRQLPVVAAMAAACAATAWASPAGVDGLRIGHLVRGIRYDGMEWATPVASVIAPVAGGTVDGYSGPSRPRRGRPHDDRLILS